MLNRLKDYIKEHGLVNRDERILLAVSGGGDSMVMLNLFVELELDISVATCNFSLRGTDSDADQKLVSSVARRYGLEVFAKRFDTKGYARSKGVSIQMAARELRYGWFRELQESEGFASVAIAHNANDVTETLLINLTRGTGLKGLTGIKPKSKGIIRPMLFATRDDIERYASDQGIEYRTDTSNTDVNYTRSRIRHRVLPELSQVNPSVGCSINSTAQHLSLAWDLVSNELNTFKGKAYRRVGGEEHISIPMLQNYRYRTLFLAEELVARGFPAATIASVEQSLSGHPGSTFYAPHYRLTRDREFLILSPLQEGSEPKVPLLINQSAACIDNPIPLEFNSSSIPPKNLPNKPETATLDAAKLKFPLLIRQWKPGDWLVPLGMKGKKKVSDLLVDLKVPRHRKEEVFVVESNGQIAWVIGYRIDDRFKVTNATTTVFTITCKEQL